MYILKIKRAASTLMLSRYHEQEEKCVMGGDDISCLVPGVLSFTHTETGQVPLFISASM